MNSKKTAAVRGRPRDFDIDKALDKAVRVFWRKGYLGTSLADLTKSMGINRPSLYAAFGDKQSLFHKALDRYADGPSAYLREALKEPTARAVVEHILLEVVEMSTDSRNSGCLLVRGAFSCGDPSDPIRQEVVERRESIEGDLRKRFNRAIVEGDLPRDADAGALARFVLAINGGIAVQAATGATRAQLLRVAEIVLGAWPPMKASLPRRTTSIRRDR